MSAPWSHPPQDLSRDWVLHGCRQIDFEGAPRPSLGRIALLAKLGKGGMGVVYYGINPRLGTEVAVKVLPRAVEEKEQANRDRFLREARLAARLSSDHLVSVLDVDRDEDTETHFLVMEYVRGLSARKWVGGLRAAGKRGVSERYALDVCIATARGLAAAHLEGIVHRDIKPDNILIPTDDAGLPLYERAKLADLGLARSDVADSSITATQLTLGTPGYMSPEQARDPRNAKKPADVFSLGSTLYALLTGEPPFRDSTPVGTLLLTMKGKYRPVRTVRTDVSPATAALLERCLARDPGQRFPDGSVLLEALETCRDALLEGGAEDDAAEHVISLVSQAERGKPVVTDSLDYQPGKARRGRRKQLYVAAAVVLVAAAAGLVWLLARPTVGSLYVQSVPSGATVFVDDVERGLTPCLVQDVEEGAHDVSVLLMDHEPHQRQASVRAGERTQVLAALTPIAKEGGLEITSEPPGAVVVIDGTERGRTRLVVSDLAFGKHSVKVSLEHYEPFERVDVAVDRGERTKLPVQLARATGALTLSGGAPQAEVALVRKGVPPKTYAFRLDAGGDLGRTPVEAGDYALSVTRPGFDSFTRDLTVSRNQNRTLSLTMPEHDGTFSIDSDPPGAEALLDGESIGKTPIGKLGIAPGEHQIVLRLAEHADVTRDFRVAGDQLNDLGKVKLLPWCVIDLSALGPGITARLGKKAIANGLRVPPGQLEVTLARDGYAPQVVLVDADPGGRAVVRPQPWDRFQALLDVGGLPAGVTAFVEAKERSGIVRFGREGDVSVRLARAGFEEVRLTVPLKLGATARLPEVRWTKVTTRLDLSDFGPDVVFRRKNKILKHGAILEPGKHSLRATRRARSRRLELNVVSQRTITPHFGAWRAPGIEAALDWLKRHQERDGRWDCDGFVNRCGKTPCRGSGHAAHDIGVTALALLSFLRAGETLETAESATLERGLTYLLGTQNEQGYFGRLGTTKSNYNHAAAALAVTEAYRLTRLERYRAPARKGVAFVLQARNPFFAWRYGVQDGENDTSVTSWMMQVLHSAAGAGLHVDQAALEGARQWVDKMTDPNFGQVGYLYPGGPPERPGNLGGRFPPELSQSMTAAGLWIRLALPGKPSAEMVSKGIRLCLRRPPEWDEGSGRIDMYYWYYATHAIYRSGGDDWKRWSKELETLEKHQRSGTGHDRGSWDPAGPWGADGGRVYATAMMCLTLQRHHRDRVLFGR